MSPNGMSPKQKLYEVLLEDLKRNGPATASVIAERVKLPPMRSYSYETHYERTMRVATSLGHAKKLGLVSLSTSSDTSNVTIYQWPGGVSCEHRDRKKPRPALGTRGGVWSLEAPKKPKTKIVNGHCPKPPTSYAQWEKHLRWPDEEVSET